MEHPWDYENNQFLNATVDSYRAAKKIGDYSVNAFSAHPTDAQLQQILSGFTTSVAAYNAAYTAWLGSGGAHKGQTSGLTALFKELSGSKIGDWDIAVQGVYRDGSPEYINLFPQKRGPFQRGTQEDRIAALTVLNGKVSASTLPNALKTDISTTLLALQSQFGSQKSAIVATKGLSDNLEAARVTMCIDLYGALGLTMHYYKATPHSIVSLYDLQTIRNHEQSVFKNNVPAAGRRAVMTHTFAEGEEVKIVNDGDVALKFLLGVNADAQPVGTPVTAAPNSDVLIPASDLGALGNRILIAVNEDAVSAGHYTVILV